MTKTELIADFESWLDEWGESVTGPSNNPQSNKCVIEEYIVNGSLDDDADLHWVREVLAECCD